MKNGMKRMVAALLFAAVAAVTTVLAPSAVLAQDSSSVTTDSPARQEDIAQEEEDEESCTIFGCSILDLVRGDSIEADLGISLNPLARWLVNPLHEMLLTFSDLLATQYLNPPRETGGLWQQYFYGNSIGLANVLIVGITTIITALMMFKFRLVNNLLQAFMAMIALSALGSSAFMSSDFMRSAGDELAQWTAGVFDRTRQGPHTDGLFIVPDIENVIGAFSGLSVMGVLGWALMVWVVVMEIIIDFVKIALMPSIALSPLGDRAQNWLSKVVSLGIVAVVGRAVALFFIKTGQYYAYKFPNSDEAYIAAICLSAGFLAALWSQKWLLDNTKKFVNRVKGNVFGASRVWGKVATSPNGTQKVDVRNHRPHQQTMKPASSSGSGSGGFKGAMKAGAGGAAVGWLAKTSPHATIAYLGIQGARSGVKAGKAKSVAASNGKNP